jgi:hypothetical protein
MSKILQQIHTGDIHFGAIDPKAQYEILMNQMVYPLTNNNFDIFSINGDLFDHKYATTADAVMYASMFIYEVVKLCMSKNASLIILHGTGSHDANQLKLFYQYLGYLDLHIVNQTSFIDVKGMRILCIPEEYNKGEDYYTEFLYNSGIYDMVCLHGTIAKSVYGLNTTDLNSQKEPVFDIECFGNCRGPIMASHVHTPGCFREHMYYSGTPIRYQFGQEEPKGFIYLLFNHTTSEYHAEFVEIKSFAYDTVVIDDMLKNPPEVIVQYINDLKAKGIDNLRVLFNEPSNIVPILKKVYKNRQDIKIVGDDISFTDIIKSNNETNDKFKEYDFILNKNLSGYEIFTMYVNKAVGSDFITVDELVGILNDD